MAFLRELAARARPFAERDIAELRAFASDELAIADFQPWDAAYASEKLLEKRYAFSEQEVKQYFTEPRVLAGLFTVIESLFNVRVKPDTAPVWHDDVRFYRLETAAGDLVGQFYLDLYARETKRGGAWMDEARARRRIASGIQKPIAFRFTFTYIIPIGFVAFYPSQLFLRPNEATPLIYFSPLIGIAHIAK